MAFPPSPPYTQRRQSPVLDRLLSSQLPVEPAEAPGQLTGVERGTICHPFPHPVGPSDCFFRSHSALGICFACGHHSYRILRVGMLSPQALGHHPTYGPEPVAEFSNCWFRIDSDASQRLQLWSLGRTDPLGCIQDSCFFFFPRGFLKLTASCEQVVPVLAWERLFQGA